MAEPNAHTLLPGAWLLISWQIFDEKGPAFSEPFGPHPKGLLQYTAEGWMSAAIGRADRPALPAGISPRRMSPALLADAWLSYFHYAGRWRIEGDCVIHSVTQSLNPNMVGTEQVRHMHFDRAKLTLTGFENVGQQNRRHVLRWQRAERLKETRPETRPAARSGSNS
jgi:hypothetical protein